MGDGQAIQCGDFLGTRQEGALVDVGHPVSNGLAYFVKRSIGPADELRACGEPVILDLLPNLKEPSALHAEIKRRTVGGNTNAPTIMIGERAADFIRGRTMQS